MKLENPINIQVFFITAGMSFKYSDVDELIKTNDLYIVKKKDEVIATIERRNVTQIVNIR